MLCDIVVKSRDGAEHGAHTAVLCAASADLKNMLVGPFVEANQVQQGLPVEMAASDRVVLALLEYIYGEQSQVELEDAFELLHLADAYNLPELAARIEAGLRASLDTAPVTTALKVLQLTQDLHDLKVACEERVAANFEMCIELADFLELSAGQLGRILRRPDLKLSREEVVVKGLFQWFSKSKDRGVHRGLLLQHVDFQSLSSSNLAQLGHLSASMGPAGRDLQREVRDALQVHKERSVDSFWPKRRCLQHWSPGLGAIAQAPQKVLPCAWSMSCHDGANYCATVARSHPSRILRWKPGDAEFQVVAGGGARVNGVYGVNYLGAVCTASVSPEGIMFVADVHNDRLLTFENGSGNVVLEDVDIQSVFCSLSGAVYILTQHGRAVEKVVGASLQPLISSHDLPAELQFGALDLFVTKEEVIYFSDCFNNRVLRINPGETEPVVVGEPPNKESSELSGLFVTEDENIYVADAGKRKVWAFHPGDAAWSEVLTCPGALTPTNVLVQGRSLYVSMRMGSYSETTLNPNISGVYQYLLPPELQLG
eukprot:Skav225877  [mRNA]  locus=scaffold1705:127205:128827:- [translate_table: standard]